jgi:hypothetical protein
MHVKFQLHNSISLNSANGNIFTGICKHHYSKKQMTNGLSEYEVQVLLSQRHNIKFQWAQLQKTNQHDEW